MMYLIFKSDGSVKTKKLNEFIQQGNNYENVFFVAIEGKSPTAYNLVANFILPNDRTQEVVSLSDEGQEEIEGETYSGRYLSISQDQTLLSGTLQVNISAIDRVSDKVLVSSRVYLTVNEGVAPSDPVIMTHAEYENLVSIIGKNVLLSEVVLKADTLSQIEPYTNYDEGQCFFIVSELKIYQLNDEGELDVLVDFKDIVKKSGDTMTGDLDLGSGESPGFSNKIKGKGNNIRFGTNGTFIGIPTPSGLFTFELNYWRFAVYKDSTGGYADVDLGGSGRPWKDLYLSGSLKDGTNSVTVANIVKKNEQNVFTVLPQTSANRSYTSSRQLADAQYVNDSLESFGESIYRSIEQLEDEHEVINGKIDAINGKIPTQASSSNQLADKDWTNSTINSLAAFYITKNAQGDAFDSVAQLQSATVFYSGGQVRVPSRNDYCLVRVDELHDNASTRWIYQNGWQFQFVVNETALTAAQLAAINSGITSILVGKITSNESNIANLYQSKLGKTEAGTTYQKKIVSIDLTITTDLWNEEDNTCEIDLTGQIEVEENDTVIVVGSVKNDRAIMLINRIALDEVENNIALFTCYSIPTQDVSIRLLVIKE